MGGAGDGVEEGPPSRPPVTVVGDISEGETISGERGGGTGGNGELASRRSKYRNIAFKYLHNSIFWANACQQNTGKHFTNQN